jgi:phosphatidate cytidylyltransferase
MKRILTGILLVAGWLSLLYINSFFLFWLVILIVSGIGLLEFFTITGSDKDKSIRPLLIAASLLPLFFSFSQQPLITYSGFFAAFTLNALLIIFFFSALETPFDTFVKTIFGLAYIGFASAHLNLLMALDNGAAWLLVLTTITAASDSGAYFIGKNFGKNKLCPSLSPGKTIEGFIGGLVFGTLGALAVTLIVLNGINMVILAVAAIAISCLGVLGDLTESMLKRSMNVKDSGSILPGHGGILDRVDSLLMTAPLFYYLIYFKIL